MTRTLLTRLFAYKSWANAELLTALESLAPDSPSYRPSLRMLNHTHVVDCIFQARLSNRDPGFAATNTPDTPELPILRANIEGLDQWYERYVSMVSLDELAEYRSFKFVDGDTGGMTKEEMLHHVSLHGAYHRGNVGELLRAAGAAPPRDIFTRFVHEFEPARRTIDKV